MTILFFEDGRVLIDAQEPLENVDWSGLIGCVSDAQAGDTLVYNGTMWTNAAPRPVLYVAEAAGEDDAVVLTASYESIAAAVAANRQVIIVSESSGTTTLVPLATFGGDDDTGYTVTAGVATYTSDTAGGVLTKQAAGGGEG